MADATFDTTINTYDQRAQIDAANLSTQTRICPEFDKFLQLLPSGGKILDAGCGTGVDTRKFLDRGYQVTAIDMSKNALAEAKKLDSRADYQYMDMKNLNFQASTFDGIWAWATLLHIDRQDIPKTLKGFYRVLHARGTLLLLVQKGQGEITRYETVKFVLFEPEELNNYLSDAGFEITNSYTYNEKAAGIGPRDLDWIVVFAQKP